MKRRRRNGAIVADLAEQIARVRSAASQFTTGPHHAEILADRAEREWRKSFPALAQLYDRYKYDQILFPETSTERTKS